MLKYRLYLIVFLNLIFSLQIQSQSLILKGKVTDINHFPLRFVKIESISHNQEFRTDKNGNFSIPIKEYGKYRLKFQHFGYNPLDTTIDFTRDVVEIIIVLNEHIFKGENIVITGTRTLKEIENHPIPTKVISESEIRLSGNIRLDEIIAEQSGMLLVEDHGRGVQIQGLDPSYALIMINGEPIIGTMQGKLNLERFAISNLNRVEIVKGPSSSLYGSNALAGVINLIIETPYNDLNFDISSKYGGNNTLELATGVSKRLFDKKLGFDVYLNRYYTDGFNVDDRRIGNTVPKSETYSFISGLHYRIDLKNDLNLRFRASFENQSNQFEVTQNNVKQILDDKTKTNDGNLLLQYKHKLSDASNLKVNFYGTIFDTRTDFIFSGSSDKYDSLFFVQQMLKSELQYDRLLSSDLFLTFGLGGFREEVNSDIIADNKAIAYSFYSFIQTDWLPFDRFNIIGSLRYDAHSDYRSSLSPKIAFSYELFEGLSLNANIGFGFKAPTNEQLYLNFTNPAAGYSVFGVTYIKEGIEKFKKDGIIDKLYVAPADLRPLVPENSISFNVGASYSFEDIAGLRISFFRNNIKDLIEFQLVALKNNGQNLFTYANYKSVYTQGIESSFNLDLFDALNFDISYQFLLTADNEVVEKIRNREISKVGATGVIRPVYLSEYGGLFNRSTHMGHIKIKYSNKELDFNAYIRGTFRSRYGFGDMNGNLILDSDNEYAPGYSLWNITVNKIVFNYFNLQFGIKNIFDKKGNVFLLTTPGRTFFFGISFNYNK